MNLYIRFFNDETLVTNPTDAVEFLNRVTEGEIAPTLYDELAEYQNSPMPYPRRFKVRSRTYFIVIKTPANTMEEFKARGAQMQQMASCGDEAVAEGQATDKAEPRNSRTQFDTFMPGWYNANITFKRVMLNEAKGKNEYIDTEFEAKLKARSTRDCYERVCSYLSNRDDIDSRSQMPSIKSRNFKCKYLGME